MSLLKKVNALAKLQQESPLKALQDQVSSLTQQVNEFREHLVTSSISSPERSRNFKKCSRLKAEIDSLINQVKLLSKENETNPPRDFNLKRKQEKEKLMELKSQIQNISKQLEPDEVEEDYFRKVQSNGVEGSTSDLLSYEEKDAGDDDGEEEEEEGEYDGEEESEEDSDGEDSDEDTWTEQPVNTIMVKHVEALSDFPGEQPDDLPFRKGEILKILDPREDGWWVAENSSGKRGIIPKTLIKIIDASVPTVTKQAGELSKEESDEVPDLPSPRRDGKELWKSLQRGSKQETSVTDVLKALGAMPSGFRSSTLGKLTKDERCQVSSWVVPKLRPSQLGFRDLVWDPVHKQLTLMPVKVNRVFTVVVARKIPLPGTGVEVTSRQVRMSLWDWKRKQILSNVHSVRAVQSDKDPLCWTFTAKAGSSMYDGECLARLDTTEDTIGILIELSISYVRTSTGERSEVSCGWCLLKLFEETGVPASNKNYELLVNGGTPFEENRIGLDDSISVKESANRLQSIIHTNQQPRLVVKLTSYNKATKDLHDALPQTLLTCHQYVQFIAQYRQLTAETLLSEGTDPYTAELIADPVISTFPSVLRTPDIMDALKKRWDERNKRELKRSQRRVASVMKNFFREVYMDSVYPLINTAQLPPFIWGDSQREMERLRVILDFGAHPTLENLFSNERLHKPFNIDRITFNVVSKYTIM
ncbi:nephrocystin-1-like [Actinia tenebrosa]|uniref:Nephrocystin-1-like n=1 Tax=Actinia tenebrosa TaxID=6105 RepID=A0A6P8IED0_ACTTE|nr:nephrocystin-1-like [Actinia tenebrosa]